MMTGAPSPLLLSPSSLSPQSAIRQQEEYNDPRLLVAPSDMASPETQNSLHLATEERGFRMLTTPIGEGTSTDVMHDIDGHQDHTHANIDSIDPSSAPAIAKATKKFRSKCWKEFVPIVDDGIVVKGKCKHCDELIGATHGSGTSSLLTHLKRCKKRSRALKIVQDLSCTLRSPNGAQLKDWSYDPDVSRRELLRMISLHGLPFTFTEYDGFRGFVASLNPLFSVPCRTTSRNGCMKDFLEKKSELQKLFKNLDCRFSLTIDMWTSNQTLGYICVTCHFIDSKWKLQKRVIKYIDVKTPHTGVEL